MLLKYNSFEMKYPRDSELNFIGIYISCQTALFFKKEYDLLEKPFQSYIIAEHILVLTMAESLLLSLIKTAILTNEDESIFIEEIEFYFDLQECTLKNFKRFISKNLLKIQQEMNKNPTQFYQDSYTYSSLILPILNALKETKIMKNTHFSFFLDDGQNLSDSQKKTLNSWISFRDTSNISFKIAIASKKEYIFHTNTNSIILENHDYMVVDLEKEFFGESSRFYDFAKRVIERRLEKYNIKLSDAKNFFPIHPQFEKDIETINTKFINGDYSEQKNKTLAQRKKIVSKYNRAIYFREKLEIHKANNAKIPYTGLETLANISTGVIRNLLVPCSLMYEREYTKKGLVESIAPTTQYEVIKEESERIWADISKLSFKIEECDENISRSIENFLKNFGNKLREILLNPNSTEKQILTFTIERLENYQDKDKIKAVLDIAEKAGLLYSRIGAGKNTNRTIWYTPNRILWTSIGLDPVGENGRINITPQNFILMMDKELKIDDFKQEKGLFDDL